jgi:hypothetical protein
MQDSSSNFITLTNELGTSGQFIELAQNGQLVPVSEMIRDRATITNELSGVERKLRSCNDPGRLAELAIWCKAKRLDFSSRLRGLVAKLEAQKSQLLTKLRENDEQLNQEDSGVEWKIEADPRPSTSLVPQRLRLKKRDPSLAKRDAIIEANSNCSTEEICKTLDDYAVGSEIIDWMPPSWVRTYAVTTFLEAYRHPECRNLVHKMISVRRRLRGYP